jgi:hypothetical protein
MKEGKGNTFSTSLNKSFFYSFFSRSIVRQCLESSPKIDQSQLTILNTRKRWANSSKQTNQCVYIYIYVCVCVCVCVYVHTIVHAMLIDIHVVVRRVTKWKMILLTRHKTMNENERIKENVQCDVQSYPLHRLQSRSNNQ